MSDVMRGIICYISHGFQQDNTIIEAGLHLTHLFYFVHAWKPVVFCASRSYLSVNPFVERKLFVYTCNSDVLIYLPALQQQPLHSQNLGLPRFSHNPWMSKLTSRYQSFKPTAHRTSSAPLPFTLPYLTVSCLQRNLAGGLWISNQALYLI